jgi:hypothetical protein
MPAYGHAAAARLPVVHQALGGGGGLAHLLVRLVIWHELWRIGRALWRIPTFGPIIVILIVLAVIGLAVLRQSGFRWSRRGGGPGGTGSGSTGPGSAGTGSTGSGPGPRDW